MVEKRKGEVVFISPDKKFEEGLERIRHMIDNGWPEDEELQPHAVLLAEQAVDNYRTERASKARMENKLKALSSKQLSRVIRRFVHSSAQMGKESFAQELAMYEKDEDERNLHFATIALVLNNKKKFLPAQLIGEKITEEKLRKTVKEIIDRTIPAQTPLN
ncbi:MAG: hypothetical protein HYT15_03540 [Candidatus Magasanikbacteria bacterium]|nr:hypothetical protein [Candidatus Magasanikbacteria bacterium]